MRISQPLSPADFEELRRTHRVVLLAFASLWITGLALIWYRTGFDLAAFSPKLWSKIIVVSALALNSVLLTTYVIPRLSRFEGSRLIAIPARILLIMSVTAGVSLGCWLLALMLGFSKVLKTAEWDVLTVVLFDGFALCVAGVVGVTFGFRALDLRRRRRADAGSRGTI